MICRKRLNSPQVEFTHEIKKVEVEGTNMATEPDSP